MLQKMASIKEQVQNHQHLFMYLSIVSVIGIGLLAISILDILPLVLAGVVIIGAYITWLFAGSFIIRKTIEDSILKCRMWNHQIMKNHTGWYVGIMLALILIAAYLGYRGFIYEEPFYKRILPW